MTANRSPDRTGRTPLNDDRTAYRVAALPQEYGQMTLTHLFEHGYQYWTVNGETHASELVTDIGWFGTRVFRERVRTETLETRSFMIPAHSLCSRHSAHSV